MAPPKKKTAAKTTPKSTKPAAKSAPPKPAAKAVAPKAITPKPAPSKPAPVVGDMSAPEQIAFSLSQAAIRLDHAKSNGKDKKVLAHILDENVELWTGIRTVVNGWAEGVSEETKSNLRRLSDFVTGSIMKAGVAIKPATIDTLININLQIAEGLLEGHTAALIRQRAYEIWEAEGRPHGRDFDHWNRAERDISRLMGRR